MDFYFYTKLKLTNNFILIIIIASFVMVVADKTDIIADTSVDNSGVIVRGAEKNTH